MTAADTHSANGCLVMVGVSRQDASIELREQARIQLRPARDICRRLAGECGEAVVVSACNRTEIYLAAADPSHASTFAIESVTAGRVERGREIERARAIVAEASNKFRRWQLALAVGPAITSLHRCADEVRLGELRRAAGKLGRLPPRAAGEDVG